VFPLPGHLAESTFRPPLMSAAPTPHTSDMSQQEARLRALARRRLRVASTLTVVMVAVYFGFILLIAFNKETMGSLVRPGLSVGILMGALVIVVSWLLTWVYVRWANRHYDTELRELSQ
jgi:uncharacterized membrane protein (DUF485 family)